MAFKIFTLPIQNSEAAEADVGIWANSPPFQTSSLHTSRMAMVFTP